MEVQLMHNFSKSFFGSVCAWNISCIHTLDFIEIENDNNVKIFFLLTHGFRRGIETSIDMNFKISHPSGGGADYMVVNIHEYLSEEEYSFLVWYIDNAIDQHITKELMERDKNTTYLMSLI